MKDRRLNSRKNKKFNTPDIIRNLKNANCQAKLPPAKVYKSIIEEYLEMMHTTLLHGYEWEMPKELGTLCIYKDFDRQQPFDEATGRIRKVSIYRKDYCYTVGLNSEHLKRNGMTFKPASILEKKLNVVLNSTNRDYRFKPQ